MDKIVTISDVAKHAGVSIATVSRVINKNPSVKKKTYDAVLNSMRELNYDHPSFSKEKIILVVIPNIENPFYAQICNGIATASRIHGYDFMLYLCPDVDADAKKIVDVINKLNLSGILLLSPAKNQRTLNDLNSCAPIVQCTEFNEESKLSYVSIDDYKATKNAITYLLSSGKKKIAIFNGPNEYKYSRQRTAGFIDTLRDAQISVPERFIMNFSDITFESAFSSALQLLRSEDRPDAFFCASDIFAAAVIKAALRLNVSIPKDVAVIGFDNTFISVMTEPSVTVVSQPQYQLGHTACELLLEQISNPTLPSKHILFETELIIRDSV